ncbi:hypothetical protein COCON_G00016140 [Conger conger]|uniref:Uncharacterized protein n=1 Tax=Conger conger TaxID=82655 RepID=A0A9Q1E3G8_CONCO|nr:hypothetical protein COCON_G00016140 [Conger conger]
MPQVHPEAKAQPQDQPQPQAVLRTKAPALAQAPHQAYTEAYSKAQALARDRFEEAKHCLQDHILDAITTFHDTEISEKEMERKEETKKTLDTELLEEFLRAAEGMEAFCTVAQLRDLEFFTESVRTQWETCFSPEGNLALAGRQLEVLKELCDTLSPEDAHRLAQAQLQECERRLAAIQRQFSGDREPLPLDTGHPAEPAKDRAEHRDSAMLLDAPRDKARPQVTQVIIGADTVEVRKAEKIVIEDQTAKLEALGRYEGSRNTFQAQLAKNKQSLQSFPTDDVSAADLKIHLQDLEAVQKESEKLWSECELQASQCSKFKGEEHRLEQDKAELMQEWQRQQIFLQGRMKSLQTAVELIELREKQIGHISERLDDYTRKPKDVTAFSLTDAHCLQDIKALEEDIQQEMAQLSRLDGEDSAAVGDPDPAVRLAVSRAAAGCRRTLEQLRQQVKKSEAASRALDRFLLSLRALAQDVDGTRAAPCEDGEVLRDCRARLTRLRQGARSMAGKAPQLDRLLEGAGLSVTQDAGPASCLDVVSALEARLEEADAGLAGRQQGLRREQETRSLGLRRRTLMGALMELQEAAERQGLKEPTLPAVQQRMRALTDMESRLAGHRTELVNLQTAAREGDINLEELESQWEDTQRAVNERQEQTRVLMELLKKFQSCRSRLSNTLQRAEQTVSEQASYMGKDNLQRLIATVDGIKEDLASLGEGVEEIRGVCRQLQSQLKKIPECADAPFESEADALVDRWLDVTEKTDSHMDNLHVGLELWDKLQLLGGEVDSWMNRKMSMFAEERHPFQCEDEVTALQDEIQAQDENIERFHRKSSEIQQLLQNKESPLELQASNSSAASLGRCSEAETVFSHLHRTHR